MLHRHPVTLLPNPLTRAERAEMNTNKHKNTSPVRYSPARLPQSADGVPEATPKPTRLRKPAHVLHLCSGPPRPDSYANQLMPFNVTCLDVDWCNDAAHDITDDAFWDPLIHQVVHGEVDGAQMGPQCSTFSRVRGRCGGPPPLRGAAGKDIHGFADLDEVSKKKVQKDNILAKRVAIVAHELYLQGKPFVVENPAFVQGEVSLFALPEYVYLRSMPGVSLITFVQCYTGSYSVKPTSILVYLAVIGRDLFPESCNHQRRWWRFTSGRWLWAAHPPALGKELAVLASRWHAGLRRRKHHEFVSKATARYTGELNRRLAVAMVLGIQRSRELRLHDLKSKLSETRAKMTDIEPSNVISSIGEQTQVLQPNPARAPVAIKLKKETSRRGLWRNEASSQDHSRWPPRR